MSIVLNPAVRVIALWNRPLVTASCPLRSPRVAGLVHSSQVTSAAPTTSSTAVVATVILACRSHRRGARGLRATSTHTGNPRPPMITAAAMTSEDQRVVPKAHEVVGEEREARVVERGHRVEDAEVGGPPSTLPVVDPQPEEQHDRGDELDHCGHPHDPLQDVPHVAELGRVRRGRSDEALAQPEPAGQADDDQGRQGHDPEAAGLDQAEDHDLAEPAPVPSGVDHGEPGDADG